MCKDIRLSVIIPLAPDDESYRPLLSQLAGFEEVAEVLLLSDLSGGRNIEVPEARTEIFKTLSAKGSRAELMNRGAEAATEEFLWFLHADSLLNEHALPALLSSIKTESNALHYFRLRFSSDGFFMVRCNAAGANIRSFLCGSPYGDQGFCLKRTLFFQLGCFNEDAAYGEDHLFTWQCRHGGVSLRCCGGTITTSPRKYSRNGWLRTTLLHQYIWLSQGLPELWKFLRRRTGL